MKRKLTPAVTQGLKAYQLQYARMMRWLRRVEIIDVGMSRASADEQRDDVLAFFEVCLHFGDWVSTDMSFLRSRRAVLKLSADRFLQREPLSWCRFIGLTSKHSVLWSKTVTSKEPRIETTSKTVLTPIGSDDVRYQQHTAFYGRRDNATPGFIPEGGPWRQTEFAEHMVTTKTGRTVRAYRLAEMCVRAWNVFLRKHRLPV